MGDPHNHSPAQLQLRARVSRVSLRLKAAHGLACGALAVAVWHLGFVVMGRAGITIAHASLWMAAAGLVVGVGAAILRRPSQLAVARWLDLRVRAFSPSAPPDLVVCAIALMQTPAPRCQPGFMHVAVAQAARATQRLPARAFCPPLPKPVGVAAALLGLMSVGLQALGARAPAPQLRNANGQQATRHNNVHVSAKHLQVSHSQDVQDALVTALRHATLQAQNAEETTNALAQSFAKHKITEGLGAALSAHDDLRLVQEMQTLKQTLGGSTGANVAQTLSAAFTEAQQKLFQAALVQSDGSPEFFGDQQGNSEEVPQLERLQKQLDGAAAACDQDPAGCAQTLDDILPPLERLARNEAREAAEALRDELSKGEDRASPALNPSPAAEAQPQRTASSETAAQRSSQNITQAGPEGTAGTPTALALPAPSGMASTQKQTHNDVPAPPNPPNGSPQDLPVDVPTAAPNRAELVSATASGGFSALPYRTAYSAYRSVAEDVLERAQVPAHRRETVRRYFHRIRPTFVPQNQRQR